MSISALTTGSQTVTTTGAITPTTGLDISGVTGDCTVHVRVQALSAASGTPKVSVQLEDSVNAFTASIANKVIEAQGTIVTTAEQHFIWRKYELPNVRFGTTSAVLRLNATVLSGTTPTCTVDGWLEQ
jgi:hypothetical protein